MRSPIPSYCRQKRQPPKRDLAYTRVNGRKIGLGVWGSPESRRRYARIIEEALAPAERPGPIEIARRARERPAIECTVGALIVDFLRWAREEYTHPDGTPTGQATNYKLALRPLAALYADCRTADFGALELAAVRDRMIRLGCGRDVDGQPQAPRGRERGLSRNQANQAVNRIRTVFKWGVSRRMVPPSVLEELRALEPLRRGKGGREHPPRGPVDDATLRATLPHMPAPVAAAARVLRYTGARPSEVLAMRPELIDRSGDVWLYRPRRHKTEHHGHARVIALGPKAQAAIRELLELKAPGEYLFDPRDAVAERDAKRGRRPGQPQTPRRTGRTIRDRYTRDAFAQAIARACDRAFPPPAHLARGVRDGARGPRLERDAEWRARLGPQGWAELLEHRRRHRWTAYQLRHARATELRLAHGPEAAQVVLGHARINTTELYTRRMEAKAAALAGETG